MQSGSPKGSPKEPSAKSHRPGEILQNTVENRDPSDQNTVSSVVPTVNPVPAPPVLTAAVVHTLETVDQLEKAKAKAEERAARRAARRQSKSKVSAKPQDALVAEKITVQNVDRQSLPNTFDTLVPDVIDDYVPQPAKTPANPPVQNPDVVNSMTDPGPGSRPKDESKPPRLKRPSTGSKEPKAQKLEDAIPQSEATQPAPSNESIQPAGSIDINPVPTGRNRELTEVKAAQIVTRILDQSNSPTLKPFERPREDTITQANVLVETVLEGANYRDEAPQRTDPPPQARQSRDVDRKASADTRKITNADPPSSVITTVPTETADVITKQDPPAGTVQPTPLPDAPKEKKRRKSSKSRKSSKIVAQVTQNAELTEAIRTAEVKPEPLEQRLYEPAPGQRIREKTELIADNMVNEVLENSLTTVPASVERRLREQTELIADGMVAEMLESPVGDLENVKRPAENRAREPTETLADIMVGELAKALEENEAAAVKKPSVPAVDPPKEKKRRRSKTRRSSKDAKTSKPNTVTSKEPLDKVEDPRDHEQTELVPDDVVLSAQSTEKPPEKTAEPTEEDLRRLVQVSVQARRARESKVDVEPADQLSGKVVDPRDRESTKLLPDDVVLVKSPGSLPDKLPEPLEERSRIAMPTPLTESSATSRTAKNAGPPDVTAVEEQSDNVGIRDRESTQLIPDDVVLVKNTDNLPDKISESNKAKTSDRSDAIVGQRSTSGEMKRTRMPELTELAPSRTYKPPVDKSQAEMKSKPEPSDALGGKPISVVTAADERPHVVASPKEVGATVPPMAERKPERGAPGNNQIVPETAEPTEDDLRRLVKESVQAREATRNGADTKPYVLVSSVNEDARPESSAARPKSRRSTRAPTAAPVTDLGKPKADEKQAASKALMREIPNAVRPAEVTHLTSENAELPSPLVTNEPLAGSLHPVQSPSGAPNVSRDSKSRRSNSQAVPVSVADESRTGTDVPRPEEIPEPTEADLQRLVKQSVQARESSKTPDVPVGVVSRDEKQAAAKALMLEIPNAVRPTEVSDLTGENAMLLKPLEINEPLTGNLHPVQDEPDVPQKTDVLLQAAQTTDAPGGGKPSKEIPADKASRRSAEKQREKSGKKTGALIQQPMEQREPPTTRAETTMDEAAAPPKPEELFSSQLTSEILKSLPHESENKPEKAVEKPAKRPKTREKVQRSEKKEAVKTDVQDNHAPRLATPPPGIFPVPMPAPDRKRDPDIPGSREAPVEKGPVRNDPAPPTLVPQPIDEPRTPLGDPETAALLEKAAKDSEEPERAEKPSTEKKERKSRRRSKSKGTAVETPVQLETLPAAGEIPAPVGDEPIPSPTPKLPKTAQVVNSQPGSVTYNGDVIPSVPNQAPPKPPRKAPQPIAANQAEPPFALTPDPDEDIPSTPMPGRMSPRRRSGFQSPVGRGRGRGRGRPMMRRQPPVTQRRFMSPGPDTPSTPLQDDETQTPGGLKKAPPRPKSVSIAENSIDSAKAQAMEALDAVMKNEDQLHLGEGKPPSLMELPDAQEVKIIEKKKKKKRKEKDGLENVEDEGAEAQSENQKRQRRKSKAEDGEEHDSTTEGEKPKKRKKKKKHKKEEEEPEAPEESSRKSDSLWGQAVGNFFVLEDVLGKGGFGEARRGRHLTSQKKFAIKLERIADANESLAEEYRIYQIFGQHIGFPRCYYFGVGPLEHNALVMDLLGPALEDYYRALDRKWSLKTVCMVAIQILERMEYVHSKGYVYSDIKPENFLTGLPEENDDGTVYLIDFGLAQQFKDKETGKYCYDENVKTHPIGTMRYMSVRSHEARSLSYRDDLESIGYLIIYFIRGRLPWQGMGIKDRQKKVKAVGLRKKTIPMDDLCQDCPVQLQEYMKYVRSIQFYAEPRYERLRGFFNTIMTANGYQDDGIMDWTGKKFDFAKNVKSDSGFGRPVASGGAADEPKTEGDGEGVEAAALPAEEGETKSAPAPQTKQKKPATPVVAKASGDRTGSTQNLRKGRETPTPTPKYGMDPTVDPLQAFAEQEKQQKKQSKPQTDSARRSDTPASRDESTYGREKATDRRKHKQSTCYCC